MVYKECCSKCGPQNHWWGWSEMRFRSPLETYSVGPRKLHLNPFLRWFLCSFRSMSLESKERSRWWLLTDLRNDLWRVL